MNSDSDNVLKHKERGKTMNLLQLLLSTMTSAGSVNSVSQKTGISSQLVKKLIVAAIPLLIKYMTKNASSASGAQSLLGALTQHTSNRTMTQQIDDADEEDGDKIITHILGDDKNTVIKELAAETGATNEQVTKGLASIAPAILSGLSAAASQAKPQQSTALDLSSLLGMFGGSQQQAASSTDLLSALLGGSTAQQQVSQPSSGLLNLFGLSQPQQTQQTQAADPLSSLFGSLLGGSTQQTVQQAQPSNVVPLTGTSASNTSSMDGTALLNLLAQFMK